MNNENNAKYMGNKLRLQRFKQKLSGLQIESNNSNDNLEIFKENNSEVQFYNNLINFNKQCEEDYRKILASFFKLLKVNNQKGGKFTGLNILNSYLNKNGKFVKLPLPNVNNNNNNNNLSQKSTVKLPNVNNTLSKISTLRLPNVSSNLLNESKNKKTPKKSHMSKERITRECEIYYYLQKKSQKFIDKCTCFVRCSDDSLFLRNCGITLEELILENKNNFDLFRYILEILLRIIYILHLLGVTHNNLNCTHVLVGKRDNINWRYMSNNKLKEKQGESFLNIPFVRENIDVRLINFNKATILQPGQNIDEDYLKEIFSYYSNYGESLFPRST